MLDPLKENDMELFKSVTVQVPVAYMELFNTLMEAFSQCAALKGRERHGNGLPYTEQPIFIIGKLFGPGFAGGQAAKKLQEAIGMAQRGNTFGARHEALGAIIYAASLAHIWTE